MSYLHNAILYIREKGANKYQHEWISDKDTLEEKKQVSKQSSMDTFYKSQRFVKPASTLLSLNYVRIFLKS